MLCVIQPKVGEAAAGPVPPCMNQGTKHTVCVLPSHEMELQWMSYLHHSTPQSRWLKGAIMFKCTFLVYSEVIILLIFK